MTEIVVAESGPRKSRGGINRALDEQAGRLSETEERVRAARRTVAELLAPAALLDTRS